MTNIKHNPENKECEDYQPILQRHVPTKIEEAYAEGFERATVAQALKDERKRISDKVKLYKEIIRNHQGTYKYDDCYDEVLNIINPKE